MLPKSQTYRATTHEFNEHDLNDMLDDGLEAFAVPGREPDFRREVRHIGFLLSKSRRMRLSVSTLAYTDSAMESLDVTPIVSVIYCMA